MRRQNRLFMLVLILLIPLLAACSARNIGQAQGHFSKAAAIENEMTFEKLQGLSGLSMREDKRANALSEYKVARGLLLREVKNNKAELRNEKLLGTAKVLLAMTIWRISVLEGNPELAKEAVSLARSILVEKGIDLGTRDRVLMRAMPGFVDHRNGLVAGDPNKAAQSFKSAIQVFEGSLNGVPKEHGVRIYIRLSQAQSLKAWFEKRKGDGKDIVKKFKEIACGLKPYWSDDGVKEDLISRATNLGYTWQDADFQRCSN